MADDASLAVYRQRIVGMSKAQEAGARTAHVPKARDLGTFCKFQAKYGVMNVSDAAV